MTEHEKCYSRTSFLFLIRNVLFLILYVGITFITANVTVCFTGIRLWIHCAAWPVENNSYGEVLCSGLLWRARSVGLSKALACNFPITCHYTQGTSGTDICQVCASEPKSASNHCRGWTLSYSSKCGCWGSLDFQLQKSLEEVACWVRSPACSVDAEWKTRHFFCF